MQLSKNDRNFTYEATVATDIYVVRADGANIRVGNPRPPPSSSSSSSISHTHTTHMAHIIIHHAPLIPCTMPQTGAMVPTRQAPNSMMIINVVMMMATHMAMIVYLTAWAPQLIIGLLGPVVIVKNGCLVQASVEVYAGKFGQG